MTLVTSELRFDIQASEIQSMLIPFWRVLYLLQGKKLTILTGKTHKVWQGILVGCLYSLPFLHPLEPRHLHFVSSCQQLVYLEAENNKKILFFKYQDTQQALLPSPFFSLTHSINIYWAPIVELDIILSSGLIAMNKTKSLSCKSYVPLLIKVGGTWWKAPCKRICLTSEPVLKRF